MALDVLLWCDNSDVLCGQRRGTSVTWMPDSDRRQVCDRLECVDTASSCYRWLVGQPEQLPAHNHPKARRSFLSIWPWHWRHSCGYTQSEEDGNLPKHPACWNNLYSHWRHSGGWDGCYMYIERLKKYVLGSFNIIREPLAVIKITYDTGVHSRSRKINS